MADNLNFDCAAIMRLPIDDQYKGFPFGHALQLGEIGSKGWNALGGDVPFPVALLKSSALDRNARWMSRYVESRGVRLAPHVKTTMAPQLMQRQIDAGAWALTVATMHQLRICRRFGARRLLLANQLIGRLEIDALVTQLQADPELEIYCLADSGAGLEMLEQAAQHAVLAPRITVLVELGYLGGRTGARSIADALDLMRQVHRSKHLALAGLETFEGLNQFGERDAAVGAVNSLLAATARLFDEARAERLFALERPIISAGGSAFFPEVVEEFAKLDATVVIRSGCYITHDHGVYQHWRRTLADSRSADLGGLEPAMEIWGRVQSIPEPGLAIVTAGRRDVGFDSGLPKPIRHARSAEQLSPSPDDSWSTLALSDQHAHVRVPVGGDLRVGDLIGFGISHPCTTFDKWGLLYVVDDDYRITEAIKTYF
jgi:D-serine dehydratase